MTTGDLSTVWSSGDPVLIEEALAKLLTVVPPRPAVATPEVEVLDAFGSQVPSAAVRNYIWVLGNYRPLIPEPRPEGVLRSWVEAVVRTGDSSAALQVALYLHADDLPEGVDVSDALDYVLDRGVHSPREEAGAEFLSRYLLDLSATYVRARQGLQSWVGDPALTEVLTRVRPYIRPEDREMFGL